MKFQFVTITKKIENLSMNNRFFEKLVFSYYKMVLNKEVKLGDIQSDSKVLFIGGGYMPCSAILIHRLSKANVTVLDNDINAIEKSTELVKKMKLDDCVFVKYTDGLALEEFDFDVIVLAMQVSPLNDVFDKVYNGSKVGTKIIIRKPKKTLAKGYITNTMCLEPIDSIKQSCLSNIDYSLLYVK